MSPALIDASRFERLRSRVTGAQPDLEYRPVVLADFAHQSVRWRLALLREPSRPYLWASLKLYAISRVETPTSYWVSWHVRERRFGRTQAAGLLEGGRPELYRAVRTVLRDAPIRGGLPAPVEPRLEDLV